MTNKNVTRHIRSQFLDYFKSQGHTVVPSSSVVPHSDPTLLFTNAGMNQFKDVFLGQTARDYSRAVTSQKCIRVGGKHNDLDNVGHTRRHLTFFEMLGNFSFGDYFKDDAIRFAWEVSTKIFGFEADRIWPSVFRDDDEAFELWKQYVPEKRIVRFGEAENFWSMGDVGPCGPCSELLYDRGLNYGAATSPLDDTDGERYLEFWNLVFMQYNRLPDGTTVPLPKPCVDTGAGLERIVSLKMDVDNVFSTDVLGALVKQVEALSGVKYEKTHAPAFHVIADHLRCLSFAIADGAQPSSVERGYVLRKVLRRAVRYGRTLGFDRPFLAEVLPTLIDKMGEDYPELINGRNRITEILTGEEEAFIRTLKRGGNMLQQIMEHAHRHGHRISGEDAFKLKDTYGFPIEEIVLLGKDNGLDVDFVRYQQLETEAKERSRSAHKTAEQLASSNLFDDFAAEHGATKFTGYSTTEGQGKVLALVVDSGFVTSATEGQEVLVVLDKTPFYAEMGGQVGDKGHMRHGNTVVVVSDTQSPFKGIIAHKGIVHGGDLSVGDSVDACVDSALRSQIANNHTATHLLHWALQQVLGPHVQQGGSVVDGDRLRFDFSHHKGLTAGEIYEIESMVNEKIREDRPVEWYEISYEEAQKRSDIKQFFGEKYGHQVRVVDIGDSKELCGGTHTSSTGTIGYFRIAKESSIAAGIRRVEALTGEEAEEYAHGREEELLAMATSLKVKPHQLQERIEKLIEENKELSLKLKGLQKGQVLEAARALARQVITINGMPVLIGRVEMDAEAFKLCVDEVMGQMKSGALLLANSCDGKCQLMARVTSDLVAKGVKANEIIKAIAPIVGGGGGGRPDSAQAGGTAPENIEEALAKARDLLR